MFCPNCGTEVSEYAMFCSKCGAALGNTTQSNAANQQQFQKPYQQQQQPEPKTWLVESILVTIFCCLPFGIVGIVNASNVSSKHTAGDFEGAKKASQQAGKWTKLAFWLGLAGIIIYVISMIALGGFATFLGTYGEYYQ